MTNTGPPPAATNKNQPVISTRSSSAASDPMLVNNPTISIDAENLLCALHNNSLQIRCDASESNVPENEEMLIANNPAMVIPPLASLNSNNTNLVQFASAFSQFSPNTQNHALSLISNNNNSIPQILPSRILFSASHELPTLSSSSNFSYSIHPFIVTLAKNKVHLPLTLFTSNSTWKLHTETTSLKQNIVYNSLGIKCHILDLAQFPKEAKIDIVEWHEGWQWYLVFLDTHCEIEIATRWRDHYHFLSMHNDFHINFPALLQFDIKERTRYCINPCTFDKDSCLQHLESVKIEVMSASVRNVMWDLGQDSQSFASSSKTQYQPYNWENSKFRPSLTDSKLSFWERDTKPEVTQSTPLCLCCKCTGHKFSDCNKEMTPAGLPTHSKYFNGKLTLCTNPITIFCITFQLSSKCQCKADHSSQHACSWCGSTDHGACAWKCLWGVDDTQTFLGNTSHFDSTLQRLVISPSRHRHECSDASYLLWQSPNRRTLTIRQRSWLC